MKKNIINRIEKMDIFETREFKLLTVNLLKMRTINQGAIITYKRNIWNFIPYTR
jgi:hypothetical protein